ICSSVLPFTTRISTALTWRAWPCGPVFSATSTAAASTSVSATPGASPAPVRGRRDASFGAELQFRRGALLRRAHETSCYPPTAAGETASARVAAGLTARDVTAV